MASDGTGSIVRDTDLGLADSAGADPPLLPSSSGTAGQPQFTRPLGDFPQHGPSAFEVCGTSVSAVDTTQLQQLTSMGAPVTAASSGPTASSQSTELFFMQSSTSSALSGYSTAALQEALQQMRLQSAPQQPASSSAPAAVAPTTTGQLLGRIGSTASQDSGDLAGLIGQAQQQMQQQEQAEDGPATVHMPVVAVLYAVRCHVFDVLRCLQSTPYLHLLCQLGVQCADVCDLLVFPAAVLCQGTTQCDKATDTRSVCWVWRGGVAESVYAI